ncbi:MAG: glycosyltransferase family 9 protein [Candidatus Zixiibacteriota bacterium]
MSELGGSPGILVCRTDALGDLILCTPVFRALKKAYEYAHVTVLCRSYTAPALERNPSVDQVIEIETEETADPAELAERLRGHSFDLALALYPSAFAADVIRRAKVPIRVGSSHRFHSWKFTHRISHSRKKNQKSEAGYNLDLLAPLGIAEDDLRPEVFVDSEETGGMTQRLSELGIGKSFVALHPGSGGSALDWPVKRFVELSRLMGEHGIATVFTGAAAEADEIDSEAVRQSTEIVTLAGRTNLRELAALLSLARSVVSNSTGPLHLAAAAGAATVGLFPPAQSMSPIRWAPPVENTAGVQPQAPVCDCRNGRCRRGGGLSCMESITARRVLTALLESAPLA